MGMIHQVYAFKRLLETKGIECIFWRTGKNEFGEPDGVQEVLRCKGLYHESGGYLNITLTDAGKVSANKQPMALVFFTDAVKAGDTLSMNNAKYTVTGTDNLGNMNLCLDVSLEVI